MKQVYLFAICSMLLGWIVGDMTRPLEAHRIAQSTPSGAHIKRVKQIAAGTIEIAANLRDETTEKDLPSEVIDERTKLQIARQKTLKAAVKKIFAKDGNFGSGGPLISLDAFTGKPRPRPDVRFAQATVFADGAFYQPGTPFPVGLGVGDQPWFAPGDPRTPPHMSWFDVFPNAAAVPEPKSWLLMILGFAVLGWRMRNRKAHANAH